MKQPIPSPPYDPEEMADRLLAEVRAEVAAESRKVYAVIPWCAVDGQGGPAAIFDDPGAAVDYANGLPLRHTEFVEVAEYALNEPGDCRVIYSRKWKHRKSNPFK